jgi:hypothetical protein
MCGRPLLEVVKLSMGVVATLAALVLGLLVASAKGTYDARESEINQITTYVILLDNLLAKYGDEAQVARASLRQAIPRMVDRIWREGQSVPLESTPFKASAEGEAFYQRVQELQPSNDIQRGLKERVVQVTTDLAQARFLLFSHLGSSIPVPFLAVLLLWMIVLFAGFSPWRLPTRRLWRRLSSVHCQSRGRSSLFWNSTNRSPASW